ncbi:pterin-4-alpha-carbinolamine dehydratase [Halobacillus karajensis]|uniref:4a-hydroxytetrahydrobiopterin dehydratase n=2 Tax=Halobacillus karajensis TaxID=195088 RepID=A0A024P5E8_9BACI|nr:4a-hydroxytetrahydrobiopterin dehydratase [Halobacillus karajensis]CDQ20436.1 Putative pterin-4-alpha-carbinolamine dehydratase [Halobacillus karajensis]CDQ24095.1 Putative pterin-4-alpha-carbinolamine dehydratase [Halobacillus karajensis]CDQ27573.1 Putative pterin-4-alpha-carbinolamine dehydratase [Halobacillus karajensis]SEH91689.1 pterin-4-alpha-carbinolamine dehydratase [Halobacillus karajensis]
MVNKEKRILEGEKEKRVAQLDGWKLTDGKFIVKRYRFTDFLTGVQFVNHIAEFSEEIQHHPFISIDYKMVTLKLTSWNAKGLTELDLTCAQKYDGLYESITGK